MDHDQNCSRGTINATLLWKCRQAVKGLNKGHLNAPMQKLMISFQVYHEPIKSENIDEGTDLNSAELLCFH